MALQNVPSPSNLAQAGKCANAGRCGLDFSTSLRASPPAAFPALPALLNDRGSHFQQPAAVLQKRQLIQGDWNTRLLFNKGAGRQTSSSTGGVADVDKDTFWQIVEAAGDKLVVLDVYSRWCGPCRLIYPKLVKLSDQYTDVIFVKLDCIPENKSLASKLGVGVFPTFKIFKNKDLVSEVKGAKYDELVQKIERARTS